MQNYSCDIRYNKYQSQDFASCAKIEIEMPFLLFRLTVKHKSIDLIRFKFPNKKRKPTHYVYAPLFSITLLSYMTLSIKKSNSLVGIFLTKSYMIIM